MIKILITSLISVLLLSRCTTIKTIKLMKGGEVAQKEFLVQVPFEYKLGLIILKVNIKGSEYNFVLDTGAPNVVSKELADTLNLSRGLSQNLQDSRNNKSETTLAKIDNINIGGLDFHNTATVISDLKGSTEIGCLGIDGFIGSNLMRKAIWKFDYQNQIITITNSIDSLKLDPNLQKISFYPEITGTPLCDIRVNNQVEKNIVLDLGSNGDITLSNKTYDKIYKPEIVKMTNYGTSSSGLYGYGELDTTNYIIASNITFGDISLNNQIVEFSKGSSTIGMNFFKNYDIIINWFTKEIILQKRKEYDNSIVNSYGFSWFYKDDLLIVNLLTIGSNAEKSGLKIGDQIININGIDYSNFTKEKWCEMLNNNFTEKEIDVTVLRNNNKINFHIYQEALLK